MAQGKATPEPVEAYGVKGLKSVPWRRTFPSQAAYERWLERNDGNVEVHGTREVPAGVRAGVVLG